MSKLNEVDCSFFSYLLHGKIPPSYCIYVYTTINLYSNMLNEHKIRYAAAAQPNKNITL